MKYGIINILLETPCCNHTNTKNMCNIKNSRLNTPSKKLPTVLNVKESLPRTHPLYRLLPNLVSEASKSDVTSGRHGAVRLTKSGKVLNYGKNSSRRSKLFSGATTHAERDVLLSSNTKYRFLRETHQFMYT
jgi:hypothetical protein